jgi:hypothetical protein
MGNVQNFSHDTGHVPLLDQPAIQWLPESLSRGWSARGEALTTHLHPAPTLKKECSWTSTPPLDFHGLFQVQRYERYRCFKYVGLLALLDENWGSGGADYKIYCLLKRDASSCYRKLPMYRQNLLLPPSSLKNKPCSEDGGGRLSWNSRIFLQDDVASHLRRQ